MTIVLVILGTLIVDWLGGFLFNYNKKKQLKRDEDVFNFKLEQILTDKNTPIKHRVSKAKELCRMTEGKIAAGAYFALDGLQEDLNAL